MSYLCSFIFAYAHFIFVCSSVCSRRQFSSFLPVFWFQTVFPPSQKAAAHSILNKQKPPNLGLLPIFDGFGGEGGIRTLAPVTPAYSLSRGAPYSHLGTSPRSVFMYINVFGACIWRRERDSNPRCLAASPVFKTGSINHSDISPYLALSL